MSKEMIKYKENFISKIKKFFKILFGRNEYIQENLAMQMKKGIFIKKYIAIVERNSRRKRRNNR